MPLANDTLLRGGTYRVVRFISQGGFGCTYEVEHTVLGARMALKEFFVSAFCNRESSGAVSIGTDSQSALVGRLKAKFLEEARSVYSLQHPGIVKLNDVFEENGTAYYSMDYIEGPTLRKIMKTEGPMPEQKAKEYILQVCDALEYVHSKKMLHLDIKPDNIMIAKDGHAMIIDFGAAKQYDEEKGENTSTILAQTPGFAPIEQTTSTIKRFSPYTDIYSLGATYYAMLTGKTPPTSNSLAFGEELPPLPEGTSEASRNAILQAMKIKGTDRPQSIAEFRSLLLADDKPKSNFPNKGKGAKQRLQGHNSPRDAKTANTQAQDEPEAKAATSDNAQPAKPHKPYGSKYNSKGIKTIVLAVLGIACIIGIFLFAMHPTRPDGPAISQEETENGTLFKIDDIEFLMVNVPGGTFHMGSDNSLLGSESPRHEVEISPFAIGETEVTQELWYYVMGSNPSYNTSEAFLPVENVSYDSCMVFISRLNELTGASFRLPTEAEWEYAAKANESSAPDLKKTAWHNSNSDTKSHPVATLDPNAFGLYDMIGNVNEWCADWYSNEYYSNSPRKDPTGPAQATDQRFPQKVYRGGDFNTPKGSSTATARQARRPENESRYIGLRLAM